MKPKNFPARKQRRKAAAELRTGRMRPTGIFAKDMPEIMMLRAIRTKKHGGPNVFGRASAD